MPLLMEVAGCIRLGGASGGDGGVGCLDLGFGQVAATLALMLVFDEGALDAQLALERSTLLGKSHLDGCALGRADTHQGLALGEAGLGERNGRGDACVCLRQVVARELGSARKQLLIKTGVRAMRAIEFEKRLATHAALEGVHKRLNLAPHDEAVVDKQLGGVIQVRERLASACTVPAQRGLRGADKVRGGVGNGGL